MKKGKKLNIKVGDKIKVITGKYKGTLGQILSINSDKNFAIINSLPVRKKLIKKNIKSILEKTEEYISLPTKIHVSNIAHCDERSNEINNISS